MIFNKYTGWTNIMADETFPPNPHYRPTMRFELPEGPALLQIPKTLSKESLSELEQALEIQLRRYHRAAEKASPPPASADGSN